MKNALLNTIVWLAVGFAVVTIALAHSMSKSRQAKHRADLDQSLPTTLPGGNA